MATSSREQAASSSAGQTPEVAFLKLTMNRMSVSFYWDETIRKWRHDKEDDDAFATLAEDEDWRKTLLRAGWVLDLFNSGKMPVNKETAKQVNQCFSQIQQGNTGTVRHPAVFLVMVDWYMDNFSTSEHYLTVDCYRLRHEVEPHNSYGERTGQSLAARDETYRDMLPPFEGYLDTLQRLAEFDPLSDIGDSTELNQYWCYRYDSQMRVFYESLLMDMSLARVSGRVHVECREEVGRMLWSPQKRLRYEDEDEEQGTELAVWCYQPREAINILDGVLCEFARDHWDEIVAIDGSCEEKRSRYMVRSLGMHAPYGRDVGVERVVWERMMRDADGLMRDGVELPAVKDLLLARDFRGFWARLDAAGEHLADTVRLYLQSGRDELPASPDMSLSNPTRYERACRVYQECWYLTAWRCDMDVPATEDSECPTVEALTASVRIWTTLICAFTKEDLWHTELEVPLRFAIWGESLDWTIDGRRVPDDVVEAFRSALQGISADLMPFAWDKLRDAVFGVPQTAGKAVAA